MGQRDVRGQSAGSGLTKCGPVPKCMTCMTKSIGAAADAYDDCNERYDDNENCDRDDELATPFTFQDPVSIPCEHQYLQVSCSDATAAYTSSAPSMIYFLHNDAYEGNSSFFDDATSTGV
jgi:hypothetical protein